MKRPLGHVKERPPGSGRWAIVTSKLDAETGKWKRKWHTFPAERGKTATQREAQAELNRLLAGMGDGTYIEPNRTTLAAFLDKWLEHIQPQVSPRSHERYAEIARKNIVPLLGAVVLSKLRPMQVSSAYAKALASGRRDGNGGLSPRTVHHMHRILKQAIAEAVRWQVLPRNPLDAVDPPKVERRQLDTIDMGQTVQTLDLARPLRIYVPALLAALCGLRRGEIAALRWRRVDLSNAQAAIAESAEQTKAGIRYKEPKSGRARTIALPGYVVDELRAHKVRQAQELLKLGIRQTGESFVCGRDDGLGIQPNSLTHAWDQFIGGTALPRIRFHDLRHAHATHLLASGVHPKVASERLGHSKVGITLDLYSHVLPGMQAEAAAKVDDALRTAVQRRIG